MKKSILLLFIFIGLISCKKEDIKCYICNQQVIEHHPFYQAPYVIRDTSWGTCNDPVYTNYFIKGDYNEGVQVVVKCDQIE